MMIANRKILTGSALLLLGALFVSLVLLSDNLLRGLRLDLTNQSLYTLSNGTQNILKSLDEPVHLTLYFSDKVTADSNNHEIRNLRLYYERVRELLEEMSSLTNGRIVLEFIDPIAYSDAEDQALASGVRGVAMGQSGEKIFFGLVGSNSTDGQAVIPFFDPGKEAFLEYETAKLMQDLTISRKSSVGLITGLKLNASIEQQLSQQFDLKTLDASSLKTIAQNINVLIVVHPKQLSEDALFAIDQFVLRGGRLMVFVDPVADADINGSGVNNSGIGKASDLSALFKAWGVEYYPEQVVLDLGHAMPITGTDAQSFRDPAVLKFGKADLAQDNIITSSLDSLVLATPGYFKIDAKSPYTLLPLLRTGNKAMLVSAQSLGSGYDAKQLWANFKASGERYVLIARLQGKFKTAFLQHKAPDRLYMAEADNEVLLVADTDILTNRLWAGTNGSPSQKLLTSMSNNGDWFINSVDNLSGSPDLITIRGRGISNRPFTLIEELKKTADERYRSKELELQNELNDTERKRLALQNANVQDKKLGYSQAQQQELDRFVTRKAQIRKELREVRRQLNADIDALEAWLKFINIALLPILISLGSLFYLFWQAKRKSV